MTRRDVAVLLLAGPAVLPAAAQQPASPAPSSPIDAARKELADDSAELAKVKLDITAEPAFRFTA